MQKFKLEVEFKSKDDHLAEGGLNVICNASTEFIAACLFQIIYKIGKEAPKAAEIATTRYYKRVLGL